MIYKFHELRAAEMCGVDIKSLFTRSRDQDVVLARQLCMYFCDRVLNISQEQNADRFSRDHATFIHARKVISDRSETDKDFAALVNKYMYICRAELDNERGRETGVLLIKERGMSEFVQEQNSVMINFMNTLNKFLSGNATDEEVMELVDEVEASIGKIRFNFSK